MGTWKGNVTWPSTPSFSYCESGIGPAQGSQLLSGSFSLVVVGQGNQLSFELTSQQGSGQLLCALPFVVSGDTATLVPGSACVTLAPSTVSPNGLPGLAIQTFLSGSATLQGDILTLQAKDVLVEPALSGPEGVPVPNGEDQVNVESLTATLHRAP
jgi:hypothetical protein